MKKSTYLIALVLVLTSSCSVTRPIAVTSNVIGRAKGKACAKHILGIPLSTDATINTAARNGNLKTITTVDYQGFFTGVYSSECTIVHGNK